MNSESYYGIQVTSDVYDFPLKQDERSRIFIQINHIGDGRESIRNSISVGWHVNPSLYGDSKAHFYRDGYKSTGCYNLQCPGYVPERNIPTVPGIAIDAVSKPDGVKRTIIFKVFKVVKTCSSSNINDASLNILVIILVVMLHISMRRTPYLIGRFPKSLFTSLGDKADNIRLGGFVATRTAQMAPMGSGVVERQRFNEIKPVYANDQNIYSVSPINADGKFTYGGPSK
ncbi:hypothetical protein HU200_007615 [Digitaria exilis]|uniref:Neprosin PEP catalytic domain-containing protein n=1 Tax=Digitaria exilis TaxID=1010633 RepID=A0A835FMU6_9POAL|nr:hypothetical protein HU200_007615 [Digitaria exilis]